MMKEGIGEKGANGQAHHQLVEVALRVEPKARQKEDNDKADEADYRHRQDRGKPNAQRVHFVLQLSV